MKFKQFLMSGLIMALAGLFVVGCNENPSDPDDPDDPSEVGAVSNLRAVSMDGAVMLSWDASSTSGVTYTASWTADGGATVTEDEDITGTSHMFDNLDNGTEYTFSVMAVDSDNEESDAVTINWAPADRYNKDAANSSLEISLYEFNSTNGSGLALDTRAPYNGPRNVSLSSASTNPNRPYAQLGIFVNVDGTFKIGPAAGFVGDYQGVAEFDQNVIVSDQSWTVENLNSWILDEPLDEYFDGNRKNPYTSFQTSRSDGQGYGFLVRTGTSASNYHYARVFVRPGTNGSILQGAAPNRFVSLVISYQNTANLPYAKK